LLLTNCGHHVVQILVEHFVGYQIDRPNQALSQAVDLLICSQCLSYLHIYQ
jgi:hypothetical protein